MKRRKQGDLVKKVVPFVVEEEFNDDTKHVRAGQSLIQRTVVCKEQRDAELHHFQTGESQRNL